MATEYMSKSADLSLDHRYRYTLSRSWLPSPYDDGGEVIWVMLNPSTADAMEDDPTIRRCVDYTNRWGFNALEVVNVFAYRTPSPKELKQAWKAGVDVLGPENLTTLRQAIVRSCGHEYRLVVAWGAGAPRPYVQGLARLIQSVGAHPYCLGMTKEGHPKHPLYLRKDAPLVTWRMTPFLRKH